MKALRRLILGFIVLVIVGQALAQQELKQGDELYVKEES